MAFFIMADNQDLTRIALESIVRRDEENVVRRATDRASLLALLKETENSVVVLDYTQFDFTEESQLLVLSERFVMASWLLISDELTEGFLRRMVYLSHAFSIVFKDSPLRDIREALRAVSQGRRYICQRAMEQILVQHNEEVYPDVLTATELEIVRCIAKGMSTKEIAAERYSSFHTIATHRKNIFRKLKVNTAHEVIKYALRAGWVDSSEFYI